MTQNSQEPLVAIVIVNWKHPLDTIQCLQSLAAMSYRNYTSLVVDNGSGDGSPEQIHAAVPSVDILVNPNNLGFAAGVNVGIVRALDLGAEYILLLNNDTVVDPHFLEPLVSACERDPLVGIVGPSVYHHGTDQFFSSGGWSRPFRPLLFRQVDPSIQAPSPTSTGAGSAQAGAAQASPDRSSSETDSGVREVEYIWGQAMLIRKAVFEQVGTFDPAFFMYYEDCDFCRRTRRSGFRILFVPQSRIWHKVARSTAGSEAQRWRYKAASMFYFHRKYARWGMAQAILQTALTLLGMGFREIRRNNLAWVTYPLAAVWRRIRTLRGGA